MIEFEPKWQKMFMRITALSRKTSQDAPFKRDEYNVWGDSEEELIQYSGRATPVLATHHNAELVECLVWKGKPSPENPALFKWVRLAVPFGPQPKK